MTFYCTIYISTFLYLYRIISYWLFYLYQIVSYCTINTSLLLTVRFTQLHFLTFSRKNPVQFILPYQMMSYCMVYSKSYCTCTRFDPTRPLKDYLIQSPTPVPVPFAPGTLRWYPPAHLSRLRYQTPKDTFWNVIQILLQINVRHTADLNIDGLRKEVYYSELLILERIN